MELVQIYDDIDSSSLSNLTLFREDKRRIIKPIPSNSIISQNGLIINPEPILLSPKQTITIIAKADINTQDRIQDFKINNTAFKFQDKYSNQVALIEKKSLGPLLSIYNPKTTIIYNPKSKETALTGTQKLFTQSFKIKPKGENANIRSITTSLESSNGASNQNIQSIHLLNSNGDILDSILSIPSGGYSLIEFTNLNIKLFKDISHTFFVAVDLRKNEANYTPPSGNIFSTKIQDVEAFGLNSGNQITQKNIQVDQSHIPDFTVHNTFPQINIQDKDPSDFQTGNQNLIDFTITNPSLTTKLHTKSIELKTFINDSATQNLSLEDIYVYSSKKELGSCSKNTSETILCNFYGPNGLQTQKSTTDDLTLRATITNFDYLSDSIKFELQQEKTSFYDEDTNTTHSVNY
jgi:hypothetical protein